MRRKRGVIAFLFLLPFLLKFAVFMVIPVVSAFFLGFTRYDVLSPAQWVGLSNYVNIFTRAEAASSLFWTSVVNTVYFATGEVFLEMITGLALALLVNSRIKLKNFFRAAYYMPVVTAMVAVSMLWLWLYQPQIGLLNSLLKAVGLPPQKWLTDPNQAMPSVILMAVWKGVGWSMIIYLAGLQGIPESLYEAGRIDGTNRWQSFRHITLPLLAPVTLFVVVISFISALQVFSQIFVMTQGGPLNRTTTVTYQIWLNAFRFYRMGFASAQSILLFFVILVISIINAKVFGEEIQY
jgi:multiple sugar transport system permease protein